MPGPRRARRVAAGAALALAVTACTGGGGGHTAARGNVSVYICEPQSLIPPNTSELCGSEVLASLFTPLVEYDPKTSALRYTGVAESIRSPDQKVWTITLKRGYTFHNGEPVDAASFARAWNAAAYGPNAYANSYSFENVAGYDALQGTRPKAKTMSGLEVVDPTTLRVTLKAPFSQFPVTLGYTAFYPLPKVFTDDPKKFGTAPVGNGPFRMDGTWQHDQRITVRRYDDYAGDKAKVAGATFTIYSNINTAYNDLLGGNLDIMDELPAERIPAARSQFGDRFIDQPNSEFAYLGYPLYDPQFRNPDLRRALSMAIDRKAIIDAIFHGAYTPATSVVSPLFEPGQQDPCGQSCRFDPARAKQLYDRAGGYSGTLTLWFNSGAAHEKWMEAVANQLRTNLGITDVRFRSLEFPQYLARIDADQMTGPFRLSWVADYPSAQNYLEPLYTTRGSANDFRYSNPRVDRLIAAGNAAGSVAAGGQRYQEAERLVLADMPTIPLWFERTQAAHSDRVGNVVIDAFVRIRLADVTVR
ncbi:MAG TPA: ABC transporter substrate-binding protein [Mycobacteriales bacterium]